MTASSTSIDVMWYEVPPIDQNGVIMAYEITYTPLENFTGVIGINSTNVSGSDLSVSLVGLQVYVNYSIQVRAYTIEGPGPYNNPVIQITLEDSKFINKKKLLFLREAINFKNVVSSNNKVDPKNF